MNWELVGKIAAQVFVFGCYFVVGWYAARVVNRLDARITRLERMLEPRIEHPDTYWTVTSVVTAVEQEKGKDANG